MKRFETLFNDGVRGWSPYTQPDPALLHRAGRDLDAQDVRDVLDALDDLSRERAQLAQWDGDASDIVARHQEHLTTILSATRGPARLQLENDAAPREAMTRIYVAIALSVSKRPAPWWRRWSSR